MDRNSRKNLPARTTRYCVIYMKNNIPVFIVIFFLLKISQSLGQTTNKVDATKFDDSQQPIVYREYGVIPLPLESAIDPEKYLLGPGDRLRILWSVENVDNFVTIGPTGNLIVPEIGHVSSLLSVTRTNISGDAPIKNSDFPRFIRKLKLRFCKGFRDINSNPKFSGKARFKLIPKLCL